jgi:cell division protein ZapA
MTTKQIEVSILGAPYRLACSPETEGALREAVAREEISRTMHQMNEQLGVVISQYEAL